MTACSVLFVCLGNFCRSPTAHGVVRTLAAQQGVPLSVDSAGTGSWHLGKSPDRRAVAAAARRGYDLSDLRARQIMQMDFRRFDRIVAMDRRNRADIEALRPLGSNVPVTLMMDYAGLHDTDVPDPWFTGGFEAVLDMVEAASWGLLAELFRS